MITDIFDIFVQPYLAAQPCSTVFLLCSLMNIIFLVEQSRQSRVEEMSQLSPYRHPSISDTILLWTIATVIYTSMVETTNKFMETTPAITDSHFFSFFHYGYIWPPKNFLIFLLLFIWTYWMTSLFCSLWMFTCPYSTLAYTLWLYVTLNVIYFWFAAVFVPGYDVVTTYTTLFGLNQCDQRFRDHVTVHLVYPLSHPPAENSLEPQLKQALSHLETNCEEFITRLNNIDVAGEQTWNYVNVKVSEI